MMAGRKPSASLVKMKPNPHGVPYPMSLRSLARYLAEWLVTMSRSPVGTRRLGRSNNKKRQIPAVIAHAHRGLSVIAQARVLAQRCVTAAPKAWQQQKRS